MNSNSGQRHPGSSSQLRLHVFLARCGEGSRRACEELIKKGRVRVNGRVITNPAHRVDPQEDRVTLDGRDVHLVGKFLYLAFHKPPGYLCTRSDPQGRPLVYDLIDPVLPYKVFSIGRLDFLSSGLLLLTNDGEFADIVMHPKHRVEKEYLVETKRPIPRALLESYLKGIRIEGERYVLKAYKSKSPHKVHLILEEGKNREIRKVFYSSHIPIVRIHRIRIGPVRLGRLRPGHFRNLTKEEIRLLREGRGHDDHSH
ncbi:pseudouridine synthase [Spirochaeta thermophila]|uniref:Pseudouridine synthase n=1 Tax=Winmispira thermophila (strain ATCC 49972 / DSM 6192 / RI 19.B1) TaxID=665571 RepID=E0RSQ6_WINT6|nr:pseudouridine synthase [Spirochaeta thermophila]ADN02043.1 putative pseudouridylate synthase [Spirochaeta thermophila DSM 6192]